MQPTPDSQTSPPLHPLGPMLHPQLLGSDDNAASAATIMSTSAVLQRRDSARRLSVSGSLAAASSGLVAPSPRRPPPAPKQNSLRNLAASSRTSPAPGTADTPTAAQGTTDARGSESDLQSDLRRIVERQSHPPPIAPFAPVPVAAEESPMQASVRSHRTPSLQPDSSDDSTSSLPATAVCRAAASVFRRDRSSRHKHGLVNFQRELLQSRPSPHSSGESTPCSNQSPARAARGAALGGDSDDARPEAVILEGLLPTPPAPTSDSDAMPMSPATPAVTNATMAGSPNGGYSSDRAQYA